MDDGKNSGGAETGRRLSSVALGSGAAGVILGLVGLVGWQGLVEWRAKGSGDAGRSAVAEAELELGKARDAERRGVRVREQAEALAGVLLEDLEGGLLALGRADALAAAAEKAVGYYRALPPELVGGETEVKRGMVLVTLGKARHQLGDVEGGAAALGEAVAVFQDLIETGEAGVDRGVLRERVGHALGELGIVLNRGGRHGEARAVYLELLEFAKEWELEAGEDPVAQGVLATAYSGLGEAAREAGSPEVGIGHYVLALGHVREALVSRPDELRWLSVMARCLENTGDCQADLGDSGAAELAYFESAEVMRKLVRLDPEQRVWESELATLLSDLGIRLDGAQAYGRARPLTEEALELRRRLVRWDPGNEEWLSNLASSWHNLAMLEYDLGNVDAGLEAADQGFEVLERLVVFDPGNALVVEVLERMLAAHREELEAAGLPEAAEAMMRRVLVFAEGSAGAGGAIGDLLGEVHGEITRLEGESGGAEGAMEARRLAAAARARSFAALPGEDGRAFELALAYGAYGVSCREAGKREEALAVFRLAQWMMQDLVEVGYVGREGNLDKLRRAQLEAARAAGVDVPGRVLLKEGASWRYWDNEDYPGTDWASGGFDDGGWKRGRAELGYGDGDERTVIRYGANPERKNLTAWFRSGFDVVDAGAVVMLRFSLKRDDGAVVYLNGKEVLRSGMREGGGAVAASAGATTEDDEEEIFFITEMAAEVAGLVDGRNVVAVEVHQNGGGSPDLSFDLEVAADVLEPDPREGMDGGYLVEVLGGALPQALSELLSDTDEADEADGS
ncbi:MAG: hypothetical protein P8J87_11155 [Verrucomicrobiales bacterium]|nr:hypothetical protein [Verrucomicrobiales bacterium]